MTRRHVASIQPHLARSVLLSLTLAAVAARSVDATEGYEQPPTLQVTDLAPKSLVSGPGFKVDTSVPTDGLIGRFTIRASVGTFEARGLDLLETRVSELPAIGHLKSMSRTKVFTDAVARTAERPVKALDNIVTHPVETARGVPGGVSRFFDRVEAGGKRMVAAATDTKKDSAGRAGEVAERTGTATRDALGYEQERRLLAKELKVDPYTTNRMLAKQLDDVAWVSFSGHLGVNTLISVVVPGSMLITGTAFANDLVWDTPRADLVVRNQKRLADLGVSQASTAAFMQNPAFALSVQTARVDDLVRLKGVEGRADVIDLAGTANSEEQARFIANAAHLLAQHHQAKDPLTEVIAQGTIVGRARDGTIVVPGPVDYVAWTERVARFAGREDLTGPQRAIWLTGRTSPRAKQELEALGWTVHEGTR